MKNMIPGILMVLRFLTGGSAFVFLMINNIIIAFILFLVSMIINFLNGIISHSVDKFAQNFELLELIIDYFLLSLFTIYYLLNGEIFIIFIIVLECFNVFVYLINKFHFNYWLSTLFIQKIKSFSLFFLLLFGLFKNNNDVTVDVFWAVFTLTVLFQLMTNYCLICNFVKSFILFKD